MNKLGKGAILGGFCKLKSVKTKELHQNSNCQNSKWPQASSGLSKTGFWRASLLSHLLLQISFWAKDIFVCKDLKQAGEFVAWCALASLWHEQEMSITPAMLILKGTTDPPYPRWIGCSHQAEFSLPLWSHSPSALLCYFPMCCSRRL